MNFSRRSRRGALGRAYLSLFKPPVSMAVVAGWFALVAVFALLQFRGIPQDRLILIAMPAFALMLLVQGALAAAVLVSPKASAALASSPQKISENRFLLVLAVGFHALLAAGLLAVAFMQGR